MGNILEELYLGQISPMETENCGTEYTACHKAYRCLADAFEQKLKALDKELFREYDQLCTKRHELMLLEESEQFSRGFRLGVKLLVAGLMG